MAGPLLVDVDGPVAVVTLHRPERRNALDGALLGALREALARLDADDAVGAIVLTGADPAFCAGLDLKEIEAGALDVAAELTPGPSTSGPGVPPSPFPPMRTPVVGAVNGVAVTGGLELALACDFLVASERARFADTHARVGVQPGWGLTVNLAEAVGSRRAREMSATGNFVDADTALAWGLVNHVVPHAMLMPTAVGLAGDIASNDRDGVGRILATYAEVAGRPRTEALLHEAAVAADWVATRPPVAAGVGRRRDQITARGRLQAR